MKVYYAHPMYLYNKPQERRDIELLESLGFEVINPNTQKYIDAYQKCIDAGNHNMDYWVELANACDCIAFRSFPDGTIGSGVGAELIRNSHKPVFELPRMIKSRIIDVETTREYLKEIGQR